MSSAMFKSTLDKVSEDTPLVTSACIGHRVLLANADNEIAASGTLRFVGELDGQNGVFCGVELTGPYGKNDGSYKGASFFRCPPKHGLFLPIHRVRLAEKLTLPKQVIRPDRLVHSAITTLDLNSSVTSSDMDGMDGSRLSTTSYNNWMDTSSDDDMDMTDSHFTYNVTRPQYLLQEVEDPQPLISIEEDWVPNYHNNYANGNLNTSYVVTNPTMDPRDLPLIRTPSVTEDSTPLVEENPINGNFVIQSSNESLNETCLEDVDDPVALINMDNDLTPSSEDNPSVPNEGAIIKKKASPGASGQATKTSSPKQPVEKKERPVKVRVPLREMIAAPPKQPSVERPKKISKQQQLMEQILANKKEHKDVPKKPVRSRLSELWTQPPAPNPKAEIKKASTKSNPSSKPMSSVKNLPAPPKIEAKSKIDTGVRLRAPANKAAQPNNRASAPMLAGRPVSTNCAKPPKSLTNQHASTSRTSLASSGNAKATPEPRKRIRQLPKLTDLEKKLLSQLGKYIHQTTVLGLVISNTADNLDTAEFKGNVANTTIASQKEEIALLAESLKTLEGTYKEQIRALQERHAAEISNLEDSHAIRVQTLEKVHESELQKHTKHIQHLEESLVDEKQKVEELRKAFDKTQDEKVQVLNEEIRSLNVMLNIRNEDIRQLHKEIESEKQIIEKYQLAEKEASNKLQEYEHDASNYKKVLDTNRLLQSELNKSIHEAEVLKNSLNSKDSVIQLYSQRVECLEASRGRPDGHRENVIFDDETY